MAKTKSPFKGLTIGEVNKAERNSFVLQIGNDFHSKDGDFIFTSSTSRKALRNSSNEHPSHYRRRKH